MAYKGEPFLLAWVNVDAYITAVANPTGNLGADLTVNHIRSTWRRRVDQVQPNQPFNTNNLKICDESVVWTAKFRMRNEFPRSILKMSLSVDLTLGYTFPNLAFAFAWDMFYTL
ncbi:hypothetical protein BDR04DRAFT_1112858 [Suillus decipiens]|nr:hypothetical protein BDR04DRAFT_1112858 [Suillus decipiens]